MLRLRPRHGSYVLAALLCLGAASSARAQQARYNQTATLLADGNILVVGGMTDAVTPLATVELLRTTNTALATLQPLNITRASHTATLLPDGRVLVTGGLTTPGPAVTASAETFDPRTQLWTTLASAMAVARLNHTATLLPTGKVLITGGQTDTAGTVTADCDIFDPQTNSFSTTACGAGGIMQMGRAGHTATLLHNGRVFAAGGYRTGVNGFAPTSEIYDATTDRWSAGPAIQARAWHTATQLGDRRVLLAGGMNGLNIKESRGYLETAEIFDPLSNTMTPAASMPQRRAFHTAVLDGSGRATLRGGLGNITTSYFTVNQAFEDPSTLAVTAVAGTWNEGTVNAGGSSLRIKPTITVAGPNVAGTVVDGTIFFSSPVLNAQDYKVDFSYPSSNPAGQTSAEIDGAGVDAGIIEDQVFTIGTVGGLVHFKPQDGSSEDVILAGGSFIDTDGNVPAGETENLAANSSLTGILQIPIPNSNRNGTVQVGRAIITAGAITRPASDTVQGFDVELTSGIANIAGGTVGVDVDGNAVLNVNATFTGITGTIANTTTTAITGDPSVSGLELTGLTVKLFYVISPVSAANESMEIDVATVQVRGMVFIIGPDRYDPSTNQWGGESVETVARFNNSMVLLPNGDHVLFGGRTCLSQANCSADIFTARSNITAFVRESQTQWANTGSLNDARANHTMTVLPDGRVLAAGGGNGVIVHDTSELFDPSAQSWARTASLKQRRSQHTATLLVNGTVLAAGGFTSNNQSTGTTSHAEIFYPDPGAWVPTGPMLSSRAYHAAALLPTGDVLAVAGFSDGTYLDSAEVFSSTAHRWFSAPVIPQARAQFTATVLRDGKVLVAGGLNAANGVLNTAYLFDPQAWSWSATGSMFQARHSHTASMLPDGRVLVVGGDSGLTELDLAEVYNPVTGTWSRVTALGGNDLNIGRLNHTATLLPDGNVRFVGGFTRVGGPIEDIEGFDVAITTFQMQATLSAGRGDHATVLLPDGFLLACGGSDGLNALASCEGQYYGDSPDSVTPAGAPARRPVITAVAPRLFLPNSPVTAAGNGFQGRTEASGGGAGSANSSHAHPRLVLHRADGASSSGNDSGWVVDLTSGVFTSGANTWQKMDSSITFTVPGSQLLLPYGRYQLHVGANSQFSVSTMVLVGPALPTGSPGIPTGVAAGASSVTWTWAAAGGTFDGYAVYSATSGVFLSTVPKSGGATETFLQRELGPDTSTLIKVAAYTLSGDGAVVFATVPVLTASSLINGLKGVPQDVRTIFWDWTPVSGAQSYDIYSTSAGVRAGSSNGPNFTQTGLSTNTASSVQVLAIMPGGSGQLSGAATTFTLAAAPTAGSPPITFVSTGSLVPQWLPNGNPAETTYSVQVLVGGETVPVTLSGIPGLQAGLSGLPPNTLHTISVAAANGDGVLTAYTALGSTYTLARDPLNATIVGSDPSGVALAWDANGNPASTPFQVLYSTDANFVTNLSTHIAFSAAYTTASTSISSLITGTTYYFRVTARNVFGTETGVASTQAFINNGGGPPGSLALLVPTTTFSMLTGTLGSGRRFEMRIPAGTFDQETRVFVSSRATAELHPTGTGCGAVVVGFSITNLPAVQPRLPVEVAIQYVPGEANLGSLTTLGMVRYDPASNTCVPMESRVDAANNLVYASLNHFSDFQLQQLAPGAAASAARVFPNPLYTRTQSFFTFDHLPAGSHVRVFTLHGEEVFDQAANASGIVTWRARNVVGRPVASGLYLAVIESGGEKKIMKLAVVR